MKKRIMSMLMILVLLLPLCPAGSLSVQADDIEEGLIDYVRLYLELPALGAASEAPAGGAAADVGFLNYCENVTITRANWYTEGGVTPKTFEEGRSYFAEIELTAADEHYFTENTGVSLNGTEVREKEIYQNGSVLIVDTDLITASANYLWLGDTQVTAENRNDILGDGTARFLPESGTLVLDGAAVAGAHEEYYQIYAIGTDLTIKGTAELNDHYGGICVLDGYLTIDADINAAGPFEAIYADDGIHIKGGAVTTYSGSSGIASWGPVRISGGVVDAVGHMYGISAARVEVTGGTLEAVGIAGAGTSINGDGLYISGGSVRMSGEEYGVVLDDAVLSIEDTVVSAAIEGGTAAIDSSEGGTLVLGSSLKITEPVNAVVTGDNILDGTEPAKRVVIQNAGQSAGGKWIKNAKGWWYRRADGTYPRNQWEKIGGKWYHFDASGYMQTGWLKLNGIWYYLGTSGAMVTGWQKIGGSWYYFSSSGAMQTGWKKLGSAWYYLGTSGAMVTGWQTIGGKTYYFKESGVMAAKEWCSGWWLNADGTWTYKYRASWKKNSTGWWYGDTSGWYAKNCTIKIDGKNYTFDANGYMK